MTKFKVFLAFTIIFSILMFVGMVGLVVTFNPDLVISYSDKIAAAGEALHIETLEECQTYLMIYIASAFIVQIIFLILTVVTGKKLSASGAADSTVEVVTEAGLKKLKKAAEKAKEVVSDSVNQTEGTTLKEKATSFLSKLKSNTKTAITEESEATVAEVKEVVEEKVQTVKEKQIDDILNSLK